MIFTDGFHVSPTVETDNKKLRERISRALERGGTPAVVATLFVLQSVAGKFGASIHNSPEGRSFGGTVSTIMSEGFWPGNDGSEAGVFFVWLEEKKIEYWGGNGFEGDPEFTKAQPQTEEL